MSLVSYPKGAVLFHENDPGDSIYIIVSGSIRITSRTTNAKGEPKETTIGYLNRGDALGEMSLLAGEPRSHTAIVDTTAEVLILYKKDFDHILEKNPTLAVHLSRILSTRLASAHRTGGFSVQPARIYGLLTCIPVQDQVVFLANLAVTVVEQTRKKVLLCVFDDANHAVVKSMHFDAPTIGESLIRNGALQNIKKFNDCVLVHPSGLELVEMDSKILSTTFQDELHSFFGLLKENYDICLMAISHRAQTNAAHILGECDRVFTISGPQSLPSDVQILQKIESHITNRKKIERIWLSTKPDTFPQEPAPDFRFVWDLDWGRHFMNQGSPFFSPSAIAGQRCLDRFARHLAHLTIGFAMGSGAAFGYALIGMLKVLERENIYPDIISGTSMGALIGAFYSMGKSPDELESIATGITRKRLWEMADPILPRTGLIRGNGILDFLKSHLGDRTFKELLLPFACVATDIQTGKEIVLDQGNVAEAVRASLSLPFFFQPYYLDGRYLVDGGLVNPVPTSIVLSQGANIILSANLTSKASERRVPKMIGWWRRQLPSVMRGPSIPEIMIKTIYIMQYEISQARSELSHVVMGIKSHDLLWWDLDQAKNMIRMGEGSAEEVISKIKSLLPYFSDSCKVRLQRKGRKNF